MTLFVVLAFLLLGPALVVGTRAHRRDHPGFVVVALAILAVAGAAVCGYGLFALSFHGYVEDFGSPPARTLWYAIPMLLVGGGIVIAAWLAAGRR